MSSFSAWIMKNTEKEKSVPTNTYSDQEKGQREALYLISGSRILLVEDEVINQQVTTELLTKANLDVVLACDGNEAVEHYKASLEQSIPFTAILMDIQMPNLNGYEATSHIREFEMTQLEATVHIPIIAMTAHAMTGDREKCLAAGMEDYISKPVNRAELYTLLASWIAQDEDVERKIKGREMLPERIAGLDLVQGLARVEGNVELYLRLLEKFVADYATVDQEIHAALTSKDQEHCKRLVHTVKGMAGSLGAQELAVASFELEKAINTEGGIDDPLTQFQSALRQVVLSQGTLPAAVEAEKTTVRNNISLDRETINRLLTELTSMLASNDFQAGQKWVEIKALLSEQSPETLINDFEYCLDRFDFDGARDLLTKIKELV